MKKTLRGLPHLVIPSAVEESLFRSWRRASLPRELLRQGIPRLHSAALRSARDDSAFCDAALVQEVATSSQIDT